MEKSKYQKEVRKDIWNLDYSFLEWLYVRCKAYKDILGDIIDLDYYVISYKGKKYTQAKALDLIIKYVGYYLQKNDASEFKSLEDENNALKNVQFACHLWAEILPFMWY